MKLRKVFDLKGLKGWIIRYPGRGREIFLARFF
jgi:hypothetical protein